MRQYEPIWINLKANKEAHLKAPVAIHPRIIQAVRKEKATDAGWQLMLLEDKKRIELKEEVIGTVIRFYLVEMEYKPFPKITDL